MNTRQFLRRVVMTGLLLLAGALQARGAGLPDLKTGGKDSGPLAILFLGAEPRMDAVYKEELERQGAVFASACYFEPLTDATLKKFNVFVIEGLPKIGQEFDTFGQRMLGFWDNMKRVWQRAEEGAGVLVYVCVDDNGGAIVGGWNKEMKPLGIQILQACIRDQPRRVEPWQVYGAESYYSWTENLVRHPVTEGLKRIYWVSANLRWDDCYTAPPLVCDVKWTPLVTAMPGATIARQIDDKWVDDPLPKGGPVLCAVRTLGKGRVAAFSMNPWYIHQMGNARLESKSMGESCPGVIDSIILKKGDGQVPSDTGALVSRLYAWLAGDSAAAGFGGYRAGEPLEKSPPAQSAEEKHFQPILDFDRLALPPSWRHRAAMVDIGAKRYFPEVGDPLVTGELKYFKGLIGPRTKLSDGSGTVAEYAAEAKKAGYAMIAFAENFEKLDRSAWDELVAQCAQNSGDDFVCLPGVDIQDPAGNHFILAGAPEYPRASWLTPDGKRLMKTQAINFLFHNHLVIAHRPAAGPLPYQRLKHFQALSVYTYRDGKLADDSLKAYQWKVESGSNPHPVVVHELSSPAEVAAAAKAGFQQLLPSDTVRNAVAYFRIGTPHFFEAPARYMISEGPIVDTWVCSGKDLGPVEENRDHFRVAVGVRSDVPLASVELYNGPHLVRRWLPTGKDFQATADFRHARQYGLYVVATDVQKRRALTNSIRTVAERYHFRCADRQNWISDVWFHVCYTGSRLPDYLDLMMPVKGTKEGSAILTDERGTVIAQKVSFPFTCNDVVVQDVLLDEKYTSALFAEVGMDAMPSQASKPTDVYSARRRNYSFTPGRLGKHWIVLTEYEITLKRDVEPVDPAGLFPAFSGLRNENLVRWENGKMASVVIGKDATLDAPAGSLAGGFIAMGPGLQVRNGQFGLAAQPGNPPKLPAGTRLTARFLYAYHGSGAHSSNWKGSYGFEDDPEGFLRAMGFAGPTPYEVKMSRGKLEGIAYIAEMTPDKHGVAGEVAKTAELLIDVPLRIRGLNPRWAAGLWRENAGIAYTGIFEETAWSCLDVSKAGKFYVGNLLTASHPDLTLEIVEWTKDRIRIEAHNLTDQPIKAAVATPAEITGLKAFSREVAVPAGATVYVE